MPNLSPKNGVRAWNKMSPAEKDRVCSKITKQRETIQARRSAQRKEQEQAARAVSPRFKVGQKVMSTWGKINKGGGCLVEVISERIKPSDEIASAYYNVWKHRMGFCYMVKFGEKGHTVMTSAACLRSL